MMRLIIGKLRDMMRKNFSFTSKSCVIRHRLKIQATITNAQVFKKFRQNLGPLIATSGTLSISNQSLITGSTQKRFQPPRNYRNRLVER